MVFTKELLDKLPFWIFLYQQGYSHKKIARIYGVGSTTVYRYLKYLGIIKTDSTTFKAGELNPRWAGEKPKTRALHTWVRRHKKIPENCDVCKIRTPIDLANISPSYNAKTYTRVLENWVYLCRRCHMLQDGRIEKGKLNLKQYA